MEELSIKISRDQLQIILQALDETLPDRYEMCNVCDEEIFKEILQDHLGLRAMLIERYVDDCSI